MAFQLDNIKEAGNIVKVKRNKKPILEQELFVFKKAFSNSTKEDFYTEISVLLKAGINLKETLELIKNSQKNKNTKATLEVMVNKIVAGQNLSTAIKSFKDFSDYEYYSLKIGEETGTSDKIAQQLGEFFNRKNEQRKQLINALTYPCIILCTAILVVIFMLQFVVPMFEDIFKQQNAELPQITVFIINISDFIASYGWLVILAVIGFIVSLVFLKKKLWFRRIKDISVSKIPFIGDFMKTVYLSQFTQAISLLTVSKVPIVKSISLVKQMIDFYPLNNALKNVEQQLLKGDSLSHSLSNHKLFDDKMIALVRVAEETNHTEYIFDRLNTIYNSKVQQRSKLLSTLIEPIIILLVGLFVGFILIAMYLPMFKLSSVLGA